MNERRSSTPKAQDAPLLTKAMANKPMRFGWTPPSKRSRPTFHRMVLLGVVVLVGCLYYSSMDSAQSINIVNIYVNTNNEDRSDLPTTSEQKVENNKALRDKAEKMVSRAAEEVQEERVLETPPKAEQAPEVVATKQAEEETTPEKIPTYPPLEQQRQISPQRVLLSTFLFGEKAVNQRRFRMFVETAAHAGRNWDFAIVGDAKPPFELPPNVKHVQVTWEEIVDRVIGGIFDGGQDIKPGRLKRLRKPGNFYKVCEYKPLFAFLFPEQVEGYQWWGHVDNDMLLGNLTKLVPQSDLQYYDAIAGDAANPKHWSWGPFTLYRNTPQLNELFKQAEELAIFHDTAYYYFDEWGGKTKNTRKGSMTHLLKNHSQALGLRCNVTKAPAMWDIGECGKVHTKDVATSKRPKNCGECIFQPNSNSNQLLTRSIDGNEVFLCHYQWSKKLKLETSLNNTAKFEGLIRAGEFKTTYFNGFDFLDGGSKEAEA